MDGLTSPSLHPATRQQPSHFRFLDLPRELRDKVYGHMFPSLIIDNPRFRHTSHARNTHLTAVLRTSRQVHNEARSFLHHNLTIHLWTIGLHSKHLEAFLPRTPILEAQVLQIFIEIDLDSYDTHLAQQLYHQPVLGVEREHLVACLPAEILTLTTLLRQRKRMPSITVDFRFTSSWVVDLKDYWWPDRVLSLMQTLTRPFRQLAGVPGGGVEVLMGEPFASNEGMWDTFYEFVEEVCEETGRAGAHRAVLVEEVRLLFAHQRYLHAREVYDAHKPWKNSAFYWNGGPKHTSIMAEMAEDAVRYWRLMRETRAYELEGRWSKFLFCCML